jgi:hypothetical protein
MKKRTIEKSAVENQTFWAILRQPETIVDHAGSVRCLVGQKRAVHGIGESIATSALRERQGLDSLHEIWANVQ